VPNRSYIYLCWYLIWLYCWPSPLAFLMAHGAHIPTGQGRFIISCHCRRPTHTHGCECIFLATSNHLPLSQEPQTFVIIKSSWLRDGCCFDFSAPWPSTKNHNFSEIVFLVLHRPRTQFVWLKVDSSIRRNSSLISINNAEGKKVATWGRRVTNYAYATLS